MIAEIFQFHRLTIALCAKITLAISFSIPKFAYAGSRRSNCNPSASQNAFIVGFGCSSSPVSGHLQLAEVATGANQRPLRLCRLQPTAQMASPSHEALDLPKDWLHRLVVQFVDSLPRHGSQLARHTRLKSDAVRDATPGRAFRLVRLRCVQQAVRRGNEQFGDVQLHLRHIQLVM